MSRAGRVQGIAMAAGSAPEAASRSSDDSPDDPGYLEHSSSPLVSLLFVAPLMLLYEVGTRSGAGGPAGGAPPHVIAFTLLRSFFGMFGASGRSLPAMAAAGILLAWHVARQDRWRVRWPTLAAMAIESAFLSLPLLALNVALAHLLRVVPLAASHAVPQPALGAARLQSGDLLILCLGAGIYEELVFRLIVLTVLAVFVKDLLQFPSRPATLAVVLLSAAMFSCYHYLGPEPFHWRTFAFRTLAGIYFGVLFLTRGFGVTAATHAAYDVLVLFVLA